MTASLLSQLSGELSHLAANARAFVAEVRASDGDCISGVLWAPDAVVVSEQALPEGKNFEVTIAGRTVKAQLAGRDEGTNVAVLKLATPIETALPPRAPANVGALTLVLGAFDGGVCARLAMVRAVSGPWDSMAGGSIDARIVLDCPLRPVDEGGPVLAADGAILGIATRGAHRQSLVIPSSTISKSVATILEKGSVERGFLGVALRPVALPEALRPEQAQRIGLMVMDVGEGSPAAKAGIVAGDILLSAGGAPIMRFGAITRQLGASSIGKTIPITVARAGAIVTAEAVITARKAG